MAASEQEDDFTFSESDSPEEVFERASSGVHKVDLLASRVLVRGHHSVQAGTIGALGPDRMHAVKVALPPKKAAPAVDDGFMAPLSDEHLASAIGALVALEKALKAGNIALSDRDELLTLIGIAHHTARQLRDDRLQMLDCEQRNLVWLALERSRD